MMKNKALKMALEAIDVYSPDYMHGLPKEDYITAIIKALEQSDPVLAEREACAIIAEQGFRFAKDGYEIADNIRSQS
jgi:hypothetical protein